MALEVEAREYYQDFYFASLAPPIPIRHTFQRFMAIIKAFFPSN